MHLMSLCNPAFLNRRISTQTLLIMKFTAFLMIVCSFGVSARSLSQTITLNLFNVPIQQAFTEIEKQSGYSFVYGKEQVSGIKNVNLKVSEATIEQVLNKLFSNLPLAYTISGKYISIKKILVIQETSDKVLPPPFEVKGRILNENREPLEGITVTVKGTKIATKTNADGSFVIEAPEKNSVLIFTGVGYTSRDVGVSGRSDLRDITLSIVNLNLNAVVVTGYSSQRRKDITGAVSVVNAVDLKAVPSANATAQLQGRASGVTVLLNGTPGVPAQVKIRGFGSFSNNNPLYVIDGIQTSDIGSLVPEDIESMQVLKDAGSAAIYGVQSSNGVIVITTKKGRKGLSVSYSMTYGVQFPGKGFSKQALTPQEQGEYVFMVNRNQGLPTTGTVYGDGATPVLPDYLFAGYSGTNPPSGPINEGNPIADPSLYSLDPSRIGDPGYAPYIIVKANKQGTNWWDLATRNAPIQNHNLTISTGTDNSRFLVSLNYFNQQAISIYQFYKRYNARINSEFTILKRIRIGENINLSASEANVIGNTAGGNQSNNQEAMDLTGTWGGSIVPLHTINGIDWAGSAGGFGTNPVAALTRKKDNRDNFINGFGNIYAEVDIIKHLTFHSSFGGYINTENSITLPLIEYENSLNRNVRTLSETFKRTSRYIFTNQLSYKNDFGKHSISALIGTEAKKDEGRQLSAAGTGFYSFYYPNFLQLQNASIQNLSGSTKLIPVSTASTFASVNYVYNNKYLLSGVIRRDGSSKFSKENRYGVFPAGSIGWRISEEDFMKRLTWLNDLKIRASYGVTGNDAAAQANNIYTTFSSSPGSSFYDLNGTNNLPLDGFYNNFVGNIQGQWEQNISSNIGFDATFLNNSTSLVFDLYQKKTSKLLFNPGGQAILGQAAANNPAYFNVGKMENWGIDVMLSNKANITRALNLTSTLTLTTYKNEITGIAKGLTYFDLNSPSAEKNRLGGQTITRNMVGGPLNAYYGYEVIGIFQTQAEVDASPIQDGGTGSNTAAPGTFKYQDISGPNGKPDGVIDSYDRTIIGKPNPKFSYGFNFDIAYKGFDLNAFFYGVAGKQNYNWTKWFLDFNSNFGGSSKDALYKSWLPDGSRPDATIPMQTSTTTFSTAGVVNSFFVENASYFRLRNVQLGYTFNSKLLTKASIRTARIYLQATNLFTITKYSGLDPEVVTNLEGASGIDLGSYPTVRQLSFGANINF